MMKHNSQMRWNSELAAMLLQKSYFCQSKYFQLKILNFPPFHPFPFKPQSTNLRKLLLIEIQSLKNIFNN
jgi:hypothetical protein